MNILVVDDEPLARDELSYLLKQNLLVDAVDQADSIATAISKLLKGKIDVIFIDISLNDENGFELADELKKLAQPPLIIFATAFDSFAVKAFDIDAIDYILKPFEQMRIDQALEKAQIAMIALQTKKIPDNAKTVSSLLSITNEDKTTVIKQSDLVMASVDNNTLTLVTMTGRYETHQTLGWLINRLNSNNFLQIHRSILVSINAISQIEPWFNHTYQLKLITGQEVPVSRSFIKHVKQVLMM
ncbi:response regulator [Oenococcus sicerae]|uniref:Response regulator n=1 Tax=Oenococcus sicerae TaxID=2203724 RepID=A0AAJ1RB03_9LACO|nr:LytTR family transcriptional regulator DNA-binding domain-containing protein [Oenococcus sicerae]MDN6899610.1 response regulator [Oenococcus sicerae]QAS70298.1 response regulator [Oenococcus sicerae]VDK14945.1 Sensory transduction protein LytR [Oenococcus sicerae]